MKLASVQQSTQDKPVDFPRRFWSSASLVGYEERREMAVAGFYKRNLPSPPAVEFSSSEGKLLFSEALQSGNMEGFFKLISYFQTQSEPAYCGLASLAMVLNSLSIDPGRKWKGPWRWYDESMLDCCEPLDKVKAEGITLASVVCLARCAGARVEVFYADHTSIDEFRRDVIRCASSEDSHLIASYNRKAFKQTGTGHFSPIGGYHAGRDMALILDVARFKYPPHWIPLTLLWEAMNTIDEATGYCRGFMLVSRFQNAPSLLYTLSCRDGNCKSTLKYLLIDLPPLLKSETLKTVPEVLSTIFTHLPVHAGDFIKWIAEVRGTKENRDISIEEKGRLAAKEDVLQKTRETELFKYVSDWLSSGDTCCFGLPSSSNENSLPSIAASVCCQGIGLFTGTGTKKEICCSSTCMKCLTTNKDFPDRVVSSTVSLDGNEQGIDVLVPMSPGKSTSGCSSCSSTCAMKHPEASDLLTVLLLVLPPHTWVGIKKEGLLREIQNLVLADSFPKILQEEVIHLRRQLYCLKNLMDNEVGNGLDVVSSPS